MGEEECLGSFERKERDKRDVGEVGNRGGGRIAEEVLNGERDEGSERRGPGQGPGLGAGER